MPRAGEGHPFPRSTTAREHAPHSGQHCRARARHGLNARIVDRVTSEPTTPGKHRLERSLAAMAGTTVGLAVLAIIALLIGSAAGLDLSGGFWVVVLVIPLIALPIGLLLIIAFIIVSGVRRSRESSSRQS